MLAILQCLVQLEMGKATERAREGKKFREGEKASYASCFPCHLESVHDTQNHLSTRGSVSFPWPGDCDDLFP